MKTKLMLLTVVLAISLTACFLGWTASAYATLWTGPIQALPESTSFTWGDGTNDLIATWSAHGPGDGWFYGSSYSGSGGVFQNVDFYVYQGLTDPTTINDWTKFTYSDSFGLANQGDTVFFRGTNNYYGAWRIDAIIFQEQAPYYLLNGQWYFQDVPAAIPVPGAVWLLGSGLLSLVGWRRFRKS